MHGTQVLVDGTCHLPRSCTIAQLAVQTSAGCFLIMQIILLPLSLVTTDCHDTTVHDQ